MMTRSQLAADVLGDAHALDPGRPVAAIVLGALRKQPRDEDEPVEQEDSDRVIWAVAGVQGQRGEPGYLPLGALLRIPPSWRVEGRDAFVCENPGIVAIVADAFGE